MYSGAASQVCGLLIPYLGRLQLDINLFDLATAGCAPILEVGLKKCVTMRSSKNSDTIASRGIRGRPFAKGNSGRKPGSKNRTTLIAAALLENEAHDLVRKAIELAKAGDPIMLKFLLARSLPRDRTTTIELPAMNTADDAVKALGLIMRRVAEGTISPSEGAELATVVQSYSRAIEMADVVNRIDLLEGEIWSSRRRNGRINPR